MDEVLLINMVRDYPHLYLISNKQFHNKSMKDNAWKEISCEMNMSAEYCKKKWEKLKDCYRKSQSKKRGKSNDSTDSIKKKWKYEDEMSFLLPNLKKGPQNSNINVPTFDGMMEQYESVIDEDSEGSEYRHDLFDDTAVLSPRSDVLLTHSSSNTSTDSKPKYFLKPELKTAEILQKFLDNKEKRKKRDHLTKFFESAEETTRSLPPDLQVEVKHRISMVLYEFELMSIAKSRLNSDVIINTE